MRADRPTFVARKSPRARTDRRARLAVGRLEDRTTPSTLISVAGARDVVFDAARNRLYVTTNTGSVARYDVGSSSLLSAVAVGTSLNGADITPDGQYLYVAENQRGPTQGYFYKINLAAPTPTSTLVPYYPRLRRGRGVGHRHRPGRRRPGHHPLPGVRVDRKPAAQHRHRHIYPGRPQRPPGHAPAPVRRPLARVRRRVEQLRRPDADLPVRHRLFGPAGLRLVLRFDPLGRQPRWHADRLRGRGHQRSRTTSPSSTRTSTPSRS